jgi:hypothetical protein
VATCCSVAFQKFADVTDVHRTSLTASPATVRAE